VTTTGRSARVAPTTGAEHYDRYVVPSTVAYSETTIAAFCGSPRRVVDHGASAGTVTRRLLAAFPETRVTALDPSEAMPAQAAAEFSAGANRLRLPMHGWCLRATAA
jgi:trans-aconitate methyltransferase